MEGEGKPHDAKEQFEATKVYDDIKKSRRAKDCIVLAEESESGRIYYCLPLFSSEESVAQDDKKENVDAEISLCNCIGKSQVEDMKLTRGRSCSDSHLQIRTGNAEGDVRVLKTVINPDNAGPDVAVPGGCFISEDTSLQGTTTQGSGDEPRCSLCTNTCLHPMDNIRAFIFQRAEMENPYKVIPSKAKFLEYSKFTSSFQIPEEVYEDTSKVDVNILGPQTTASEPIVQTTIESLEEFSNYKPRILDLIKLTSYVRINFKELIKDGDITTFGITTPKGSLKDVVFVVDVKNEAGDSNATAEKDAKEETADAKREIPIKEGSNEINETTENQDQQAKPVAPPTSVYSLATPRTVQSSPHLDSASQENQEEVMTVVERLTREPGDQKELDVTFVSNKPMESSVEVINPVSLKGKPVKVKHSHHSRTKRSTQAKGRSSSQQEAGGVTIGKSKSACRSTSETPQVKEKVSSSAKASSCRDCKPKKKDEPARKSRILDNVYKTVTSYLLCYPETHHRAKKCRGRHHKHRVNQTTASRQK